MPDAMGRRHLTGCCRSRSASTVSLTKYTDDEAAVNATTAMIAGLVEHEVRPVRVDVQLHRLHAAGPPQEFGERPDVERGAVDEDDPSVVRHADAGAPDIIAPAEGCAPVGLDIPVHR